jgi:RHS repeat-associated protein
MFRRIASCFCLALVSVFSAQIHGANNGGIVKQYIAEGQFLIYTDLAVNNPTMTSEASTGLSSSSCIYESQLSEINSGKLPDDGVIIPVQPGCETIKWYRSKVGTLTPIPGELLAASSMFVRQGILPIGDYQYRYQKCSAFGSCGDYSTPLALSVKAVSTPTQLIAETPSFTSVELSWNGAGSKPTNTLLDAHDHIVEQSVNGGAWSKVYVGGKTNIDLAVSEDKYDFRVKSCSFGQCSAYASFATVTQQKPQSAGAIKELNYQLLKDKYGNYYLKPPKTFVLLAGEINIPLFIDSNNPTLMLSDSGGSWGVFQVSDATLQNRNLVAVDGYQISYRDYDGDERIDLEVRLNGVSQLPGFAILDIASTYHSILVMSESGVIESNPEADVRPAQVVSPLKDTDNGEVVGAITAEMKVTPMGTASYTVPIEQAPGSAGLVPNLAMQYDSSQGNGWLGMGWSLSGVSVISRCAQNKEQDGKALAVNFTSSDRFCLDGKKLFINNNSTYGDLGSQYRFETSNPLKIEITQADSDGASEFTVKNNDGSTLVYSAINLTPSATDGGPSGRPAAAWPLAKKIDAAGNEITFEYESSDAASLSYRLKNVIYANGLNHIEFNYEDRDDKQIGYAGGYQFNIDKRLKSVVSYVDSQELRSYSLAYIQSATTGRSLLQSIEASRGSSYLPKTVFDWKQGSLNYTSELVYSHNNDDLYHNSEVQGGLPYLMLDMNGDGKLDYWKIRNKSRTEHDDIFFILGGDSFEQINYFRGYANLDFRTSAEVIDIDNDGRDDVIFNKDGQWHIYRSIVDKLNPSSVNYPMDSPLRTNMPVVHNDIKVADFNSDGYPDISYIHNENIYVHYNLNVNSGFGQFSAATVLTVPGLAASRVNFSNYFYKNNANYLSNYFRVIDIDGDGENEFLVGLIDSISLDPGNATWDSPIFTGSWLLFKNDNGVLTEHINIGRFDTNNRDEVCTDYDEEDCIIWNSPSNTLLELDFKDINGDGLQDAVYGRFSTETNRLIYSLYVKINTGTSFMDESFLTQVDLEQGLGLGIVSQKHYFNDFNGDGYLDYIVGDGEYFSVRYFDGEQLATAITSSILTRQDIVTQFSDINGDGNLDFISHYGRLSNWRNTGGARDVIGSITDGLSNKTSFGYGTINQASAGNYYVRDVDATSKNWGNGSLVIDVNQAVKVVTSVTTQDSYLTYQYRGLKAQHGRGMLGFAEVANFEPLTSTKRVAYYRQDFPYTGLLYQTKTYSMPKVATGDTSEPPEPPEPPVTPCRSGENCEDPRVAVSLSSVAVSDAASDASTGPSLLSETHIDYAQYINSSGYVYPKVETSSQYEVHTGKQLSHTVTTNSLMDAWGNTGKVEVVSRQSAGSAAWYSTVTTNSYERFNDFIGGRLAHQTVSYARSGQADVISRQSHFEYDALGLLAVEENDGANGQGSANGEPEQANYHLKKSYSRDNFGNVVVQKVQGDGIKTQFVEYQYDAYGRYVTKETHYRGFPQDTLTLVSSYSYHPVLGSRLSEKDANGLITHYDYSQLGRLNFTQSPDGSYSSIDQQLCQSDCMTDAYYYQITENSHAGDMVEYFDSSGRKLAEKAHVARSYSAGSLVREWQWRRYRYDNLGRVTATSIPHFSDSGITQLEKGSDISALPLGYMGVEYDVIGRKIATTDAEGNRWTQHYDMYTVTETDPGARSKSKILNEIGELLQAVDVNGVELNYGYNAAGNVVSISRDNSTASANSGQIITKSYFDHLGRKFKMIDPDKGTLEYRYDALGKVIWQKDNKGQVTTQEYDALGRPIWIKRQFANGELDQHTSWVYDAKDHAKGLVSSVTDNINQLKQSMDYHWLSKVKSQTVTHGAGALQKNYTQRTFFYGPEHAYAAKTVFDATGYGIGHLYVDNTLVEKTNLRNNRLLWRFSEADAWGNTTQYQLGNKLTTKQTFNTYRGNLTGIKTGTNASVQNLSYQFDLYGDLEYRRDNLNNIEERFSYDELHRLTGASLSNYTGITSTRVDYDELGNILFKTGVGSYHYESARPHAVSRISDGDLAGSFSYDANGNMLQGGGRSRIDYNTVDKPTLIEAGSQRTEFAYGFGGVRFKRIDSDGSSRKETLYVGNVEFTKTNGMMSLIQRHLAGVAVELDYLGANARQELHYLYRDHLGSVTVMTDANGAVVSEHSFDVWGQRRAFDTGNAHPLKQLNRALAFAHKDYNRGFTGHEHIDALGIIHMNGRVYDPRLARFLSVDPLVADGTDLQAYNRYSYVGNNPLNATDPSGYEPVTIMGIITAALGASAAVITAVDIAYAIYVVYAAVETIYSTVQAFKYGDGGFGSILTSVMAAYGAYSAVSGMTSYSSAKGTGAEGTGGTGTGSNARGGVETHSASARQGFVETSPASQPFRSVEYGTGPFDGAVYDSQLGTIHSPDMFTAPAVDAMGGMIPTVWSVGVEGTGVFGVGGVVGGGGFYVDTVNRAVGSYVKSGAGISGVNGEVWGGMELSAAVTIDAAYSVEALRGTSMQASIQAGLVGADFSAPLQTSSSSTLNTGGIDATKAPNFKKAGGIDIGGGYGNSVSTVTAETIELFRY